MLISGKTDLKIKTVTRDKEGPYIMIKGSSGFSDSSAGKESTCKAEEPSSIPGSGRSARKEIGYPLQCSWASLVAHLVKNPPAMCVTWVQSLGREDCLEEGLATRSNILGWRIPVDRGAWWAPVHGVAKSRTRLSFAGNRGENPRWLYHPP